MLSGKSENVNWNNLYTIILSICNIFMSEGFFGVDSSKLKCFEPHPGHMFLSDISTLQSANVFSTFTLNSSSGPYGSVVIIPF